MIAIRKAAKPPEHAHWKLVDPDGVEREYGNYLDVERDGRDGDALFVWMTDGSGDGVMKWVRFYRPFRRREAEKRRGKPRVQRTLF